MKNYKIGFLQSNDTTIKNEVTNTLVNHGICTGPSDVIDGIKQNFNNLTSNNIRYLKRIGGTDGALITSLDDLYNCNKTPYMFTPTFTYNIAVHDNEGAHIGNYCSYSSRILDAFQGLWYHNLIDNTLTKIWDAGYSWSNIFIHNNNTFISGPNGTLCADMCNTFMVSKYATTVFFTDSIGRLYLAGNQHLGITIVYTDKTFATLYDQGYWDVFYESSTGDICAGNSTQGPMGFLYIKNNAPIRYKETATGYYKYFCEDSNNNLYVSPTSGGLIRITESGLATVLSSSKSHGWYVFFTDHERSTDFWCPIQTSAYTYSIYKSVDNKFSNLSMSYDESYTKLCRYTNINTSKIYFSDGTPDSLGFYLLEYVDGDIVEHSSLRRNYSVTYAHNGNTIHYNSYNSSVILCDYNGEITSVEYNMDNTDSTLYSKDVWVHSVFTYNNKIHMLIVYRPSSNTYRKAVAYYENGTVYIMATIGESTSYSITATVYPNYDNSAIYIVTAKTLFYYKDGICTPVLTFTKSKVIKVPQECSISKDDFYLYTDSGIYYICATNTHLIYTPSFAYSTSALGSVYTFDSNAYIYGQGSSTKCLLLLKAFDSLLISDDVYGYVIKPVVTNESFNKYHAFYYNSSNTTIAYLVYLDGVNSTYVAGSCSCKESKYGLYIYASSSLYYTRNGITELLITGGSSWSTYTHGDLLYVFNRGLYTIYETETECTVTKLCTTTSTSLYTIKHITANNDVYFHCTASSSDQLYYYKNGSNTLTSTGAYTLTSSPIWEPTPGVIYTCSNDVDYNYDVYGLYRVVDGKATKIYTTGEYWNSAYLSKQGDFYISSKNTSIWSLAHGILKVDGTNVKRIWDRSVSFQYVQETPNGLLVANTEFIGPDDKILYIKGDRVMETSINEINAYNKEANNE